MTSRPERISQQPTSADQTRLRSNAYAHSPTRSGRQATFARDAILFVVAVALLMVWAARSLTGGSLATPGTVTTVAVHTVTPQCVSAEDMARRYGWEGDWRECMVTIKELNGWDRWPILHVGDPVFVPDYRDREDAYEVRATPAKRRAQAYPAARPGSSDAAGSTYQDAMPQRGNQRLDRLKGPRSSTTGRPVEVDTSSRPRLRQGRAARTHLHGGNHDSTAAAPNPETDR